MSGLKEQWKEHYTETLTEKKLINYLISVTDSKEFQDRISNMSLSELGEMYGCSEQEMLRLIKIEKERQHELHKHTGTD